jgi:3-carboxy-cis,cis-muconate cycloisomerase
MSKPAENSSASLRLQNILSLESRIQTMLQFEAALAKAEAEAGLIPEEAAATIVEYCKVENFDAIDLETRGTRAGTLVIPLVKDLVSKIKEKSPEASHFVQFGSTSQDVLDTAMILQLKDSISILNKDLERIEAAFAKLANEHRSTLLLGRTLLQPAPPITFGLKASGWAAAVRRGRERLNSSAEKALVLQFGGAVGTLSVLGPEGVKVAELLAAELGLPLPDAPWHSHRDRLVELASAVAILVGSLGKIAKDMSLHMQAEVAELSEPEEEGRGGSSAMPHKRNPIGCMTVLAAANRVPGLLSSLFTGMTQEHERGLGGWQAEWKTIPDIFQEAANAISAMVEVSEGLKVNTENMRTNFDATKEIVFSEALAAALSPKLGRTEAQRLVAQLVKKAVSSEQKLSAIASANETVVGIIDESGLKQIFDPSHLLGSTSVLIERLLGREPGE